MKYDARACHFNMDTGCVELLLRDGRKISIKDVRFSQHGSALFIQKLLSGERIVLVNEVRFDGGVVRVLRGDMLERCHTVHPELSRRAAGMRSGLQVRQGVSLVSARCPHRQN